MSEKELITVAMIDHYKDFFEDSLALAKGKGHRGLRSLSAAGFSQGGPYFRGGRQ
ncbi:MAG: hypothetical protein ABSB79_07560 [Syntrophales bacterium]|jgi:hypothetical protein